MKKLLAILLLTSLFLFLVSCNTFEGLMKDLGIEYGSTDGGNTDQGENDDNTDGGNTDQGGNGDNTDGGNTDQGGNGDNTDGGASSKESEWRSQYECITVAEALEICKSNVGTASANRYYIIATVTSIEDYEYGEMYIEDSTGEIYVYGTRGADGNTLYGDMMSAPTEGDVILIYATLMTYNGKKEVENGRIIDFYTTEQSGDGDDSGSTGGDSGEITFIYEDFTTAEKSLMTERIGLVIPFIPNNEYYVEEYEDSEYGEWGIEFYTYGNTEMQFKLYLLKFASYTSDGEYEDQDGDTWYCYSSGDLYIDTSFYYYEGDYVVHLFAYFIEDEGGDNTQTGGNSGNTGGGSSIPDSVITNSGAGLPEGKDGVYGVDFTKAEKVKDVTDQGSYQDGCPTTGSPAVLVIPVQFSNATAASKGYTIDKLVEAFEKGGTNDYYSLYDYYYKSSYGKLTLDITVLDEWFTPKKDSNYYYAATYEYYGENIAIGDQLILNEALDYLEELMDLSKFDSDNNGIIDAVILINTLDIGEEDFYWAYRYWNVYTDDEGYYYEYDGVSANDYIWASYQFLWEGYGEDGEAYYDASITNPYTFIHEFAHVLGADDYYDTAYESDDSHPLGGNDIMDAMTGDHNAYTKFNLGWLTTSRLVVTDGSVTLTLEDFGKNGDTVIIANNWDEKLGVYQEYYIIVYYTNKGLNSDDAGYFDRDGIVVYHVNASLIKESNGGEVTYNVYNNNTHPSDEYGTEDNLIEFVKTAADTYTYAVGDTLPPVTDDQGNALGYTFTVVELNENEAVLTFTAI